MNEGTRGWNRPTAVSPAMPRWKSKPSYMRGVLAGGIVVALAGAAVWFFLYGSMAEQRPGNDPNGEGGKGIAKPLQTKPGGFRGKAAGSTSGQETLAEDGKPSEARPGTPEDATAAETNNIAEIPKPKRRFTNPMDQLLAMVAPREVGDPVPPVPINDGIEFTPEQEDQMFELLAVEDGDSEEAIAKKELVQAMRDEYADLKKNRGWKFVDYVKALEAKAQLDSEVLTESAKIHDTVFNDPDISDEKYLETLEKINRVLGGRGIKPIAPPAEEPMEANANQNQGDTK